MNLYAVALIGHSYLRWAVLLAMAVVLGRALLGWRTGRSWTRADERLHATFVGLVDLQLTLGAALYLFLSPLSHAFFSDPGTSIKVAPLRFFGLEHPVTMLLAVAIVHIGRARSKRAANDRLRHRRAFTSAVIALLLICASIPWPGLDIARPLLR